MPLTVAAPHRTQPLFRMPVVGGGRWIGTAGRGQIDLLETKTRLTLNN